MAEEPIISKIQKLLSLALNNSNPAEAEAAMAKVKELMVKHAVDESKLRGKDAPQLTDLLIIDLGRRLETWMKTVHVAIAAAYECRVIHSSGYGKDTATFICADYDKELIKETVRYVVSTILRESAKITKGRTVADAFRSGAALGFYNAVKDSAPAPVSKANTSIILARGEAIQARTKELYPSLKAMPLRLKSGDDNAFNAGYKLGNGLNTGKASKKLEE